MACMHACTGDACVETAVEASKSGKKSSLRAVLDTVGNLWDEHQYAEDLSLEAFMAKLEPQ